MTTTPGFRSAADAAAALDDAHQQIVAGEIRIGLAVAALCDLHQVDDQAWFEGMERWVDGGADGTPRIGEFVAGEIAGLLGCSVGSALARIRTVMNLRHRHPTLWAGFLAGRMRYWEVERVSDQAVAAELDAAGCARLDRMCAVALRMQPWGRVWPKIPKWIIKADPQKARERAAAAARERYVQVSGIDDGQAWVRGQVDAADGIAFDQALDLLADLVEGETKNHRRAAAVGVLARMVFGQDALPVDTDGDGETGLVLSGTEEPAGPDLGKTPTSGATGPGDAEEEGFASDPDQVLPADSLPGAGVGAAAFITPITRTAEVVVRIDAADLIDPTTGVASIDRWGHTLLPHLQDVLAGCRVTVRPVVAGADLSPVDGYRVPAGMRLAVQARNPVDVFPYGTRPSASCEIDHTNAFDHVNKQGRGQTRPDNLGPLSKYTHRLKTHGGWHLTQPAPGVFDWVSPLGYQYRVTPDGTVKTGKPPRRTGVRPTRLPARTPAGTGSTGDEGE
ncbi:DUF222 domain-containing protein [Enemella sp. A6]|uniref:HNH endonuclease signature motif containing protein n=1 Tax=Enemella sp. A6 TaxID=3440152 RepID=UPI003EBFC2F4